MQAAYEALLKVASSSGSRQLRASCPRLLRDILAVITGLRPAFMLDYGALPPAQLAAATAALAAALQLQGTAAQCCVAVLGDCCYLVRPQGLPDLVDEADQGADACLSSGSRPGLEHAAQLQQLLQQRRAGVQSARPAPVMFVAFDGPRPRWASPEEAREAAAALHALRTALLAAVELHAGEAPNQHPSSGGARGSSGGGTLPVVEVERLPGWQSVAPPTASGYLLGYPALYLCHSLEGAQAATRGLSSASLCLHTVACGLASAPVVPRLEGQPLLGFSVPVELAAAPQWQSCRDAWWAALQGRAAAGEAGTAALLVRWEHLQLHAASQPPRPVAL